jgi:hypothetical protein
VALKRHYNLVAIQTKPLVCDVWLMRAAHGMKFIRNLESERLGGCISQTKAMKTISPNPEAFESTYALLVRSEEKQRSRFETLIYTLLIVSTTFAVVQFGRQAVMMPPSIAHVSTTASAAARYGV